MAQDCLLRTFFCNVEKKLSIAALSPAAPTRPMDPASLYPFRARWNFRERNCDPLSELTRIRVNSDYAEVFVKPRNLVIARVGADG